MKKIICILSVCLFLVSCTCNQSGTPHIKLGSCVRLKIGGPLMQAGYGHGLGNVKCIWVDDLNVIHIKDIDEVLLVEVPCNNK